jgi:hypothetical protein
LPDGEANGLRKLDSYDGFELDIVGNGKGGIEVRVNAVGQHVPPIKLTFVFISISRTCLQSSSKSISNFRRHTVQ